MVMSLRRRAYMIAGGAHGAGEGTGGGSKGRRRWWEEREKWATGDQAGESLSPTATIDVDKAVGAGARASYDDAAARRDSDAVQNA